MGIYDNIRYEHQVPATGYETPEGHDAAGRGEREELRAMQENLRDPFPPLQKSLQKYFWIFAQPSFAGRCPVSRSECPVGCPGQRRR